VFSIEESFEWQRAPFMERRNSLISQVPKFWARAFLRHPMLGNLVHVAEVHAIQFLNSINVEEYTDAKAGFCLTFGFQPNPFFSNTELHKMYHHDKGNESISTSSNIDWLPSPEAEALFAHLKSTEAAARAGCTSFFAWFVKNDRDSNDLVCEAIKDSLWRNPLAFYRLPNWPGGPPFFDDETN